MKRRVFISFSFYIFTKSIAKDTSTTPWDIMDTTLNHLFPQNNNFFGAKKLDFLYFLTSVSKDKYFDNTKLDFLLLGATRLYTRNSTYINSTNIQKEKILRKFEKTTFGKKWLSSLMYYGFEAMLSDPIYGGNKNSKGWNALNHNTGLPQPKIKYGKNNV
jgi:gluconate 2-dehydrogenase gamma chain